MLAAAAGALGVLAAHWGASLLVALVPKSATVPGLADVHINTGVIVFTLAVSVGTALLFGLVSATDMYFPFEQQPSSQITLFMRSSGDPGVAALRSTLRAIESDVVTLEPRWMSEVVSDSVHVTRLALTLLGVFAVIALALAAIGIYGVLSYVVRQRTREIGTRIALGATSRDIVWLVMRQGALIAGVGAVAGGVAAAAAARLLQSILFGTAPSDPATFTAAAFVLIATTMAVCYLPARRAARVDPARTLGEP